MSDGTPAWLLESESRVGACSCGGSRRRTSFVDKTISGTVDTLRRAMATDEIAAQNGLLQRVDPRVKVVLLAVALVATALVHNAIVLLAVSAITIPVAAASAIPVRFFVKRVWLVVPLFTGLVMLPATLNVVTTGHVVHGLGTWFGHTLGVTDHGLASAILVVMRVGTSVSLVVVVTMTTPWQRVVGALRVLRLPRMFTMIAGMTYRYIFVLLGSVSDMYTARKSRTGGRARHTRRERAFVASTAGALFGKAHALSEEVHMAMVARGFTGDVPTQAHRGFTRTDVLTTVSTLAVVGSALGVDRVVGIH